MTPKTETSEVELKITVTPAEFTPYIERAAKKLSEEHPPKGFRPGKVTLPIAFETYGTERVLQGALEPALRHFFVQAVLDHDIEALSRPAISVEELGVAEGLRFVATTAVIPSVTLGDPKTITITRRTPVVSDEDVTKELNYLAKMRSTPLEVARPAEVGDTVTVDFKVFMDGQLMEGGESQNHPVHLGEGHFVPDFEQKLQGIQAGDEREFSIAFPADYARKELQGKEAKAWVKAHAVQKQVLPELNDEFAKKLGKFDSLAQLREELKKNMIHEREHKEEDRFHGELAEKLAEISSFGVLPTPLVDREIDQRLQEFTQMLAYQQKTIDDYLAQNEKTIKDVREELQPTAEKAVKVGLAMRAFALQEKIEVEEKEVAEKVQQYLARYASTEKAQQDIDQDELRESFTSTLRNQKALKRLSEVVHVTTEVEQEKKPDNEAK